MQCRRRTTHTPKPLDSRRDPVPRTRHCPQARCFGHPRPHRTRRPESYLDKFPSCFDLPCPHFADRSRPRTYRSRTDRHAHRGSSPPRRAPECAARPSGSPRRGSPSWRQCGTQGDGCPVPATVRRPSAVELTTAFISQHNQHSDLHRYHAPNTAKRYKRPDNRIRLTGQLAPPSGRGLSPGLCAPTSRVCVLRRRAAGGNSRPSPPPADRADRR
jgi:hypothetical protein